MRTRRFRAVVGRGLLVAGAAAVIGGCGGSSAHHDHTATASTTATAPITTSTRSTTSTASGQTADYQIESSALVTMRQFSPESLLWQTVSLAPSGKGLLTTLIGEVSGAQRRPFRLPSRQALILRRLVAMARTVKPPPQGNPDAMLYTLYITGEPSANIQGPAPKRLAKLITFLSALMMTYCC